MTLWVEQRNENVIADEKKLRELLKKQERLLEATSTFGEASTVMSDDLSNAAQETNINETNANLIAALRVQLVQIESAIEKATSGTYGICTDCQGKISSARLAALPTATRCLKCQQKAE